MAVLVKTGEVALRKGCSKKAVIRGCEQGKLNHEYDVVTNEYEVYDDATLAAWQPPGQQEGRSPGSQ